MDEALSLAAMFQFAGFPHVVGTPWQCEDKVAAKIARTSYAKLKKGINSSLGLGRAIATALHFAVLERKAESPDDLLSWALYIH